MSGLDDYPDWVDDDDDRYCDECGGTGWIVDCCDDMCVGQGWCMHGDGDRMCECNKSCDPPAPPNAPREWQYRYRRPK